MSEHLNRLIAKIQNCPNYRNLVALEEDFNNIGLSIQYTPKDWFVLCKIVDNRPVALNVFEDYIFLNTVDRLTEELTQRMSKCIIDFAQNKSSGPTKILDTARQWRNGVRTYGEAIIVFNEDIERVLQQQNLMLLEE